MPFYYVANLPKNALTRASETFVSWHHLQKENAALRANQLALTTQLQQLNSLINENNELRALFHAANTDQHSNSRSLVSEIIALNTDPFDQQFILDKGSKDGVYVGQPVLDNDGVVGQVIDVTALGSKVLSISSIRSNIPVVDTRSGIRAIAKGEGYTGNLALTYVPFTSDVQAGDTFVTSGLGFKFPGGYTVGVVKSVDKLSTEKFAVIKLEPKTALNKVKFVILIWPKQNKIMQEVKDLLNK
jgi:rod shape-determining protein MreC